MEEFIKDKRKFYKILHKAEFKLDGYNQLTISVPRELFKGDYECKVLDEKGNIFSLCNPIHIYPVREVPEWYLKGIYICVKDMIDAETVGEYVALHEENNNEN